MTRLLLMKTVLAVFLAELACATVYRSGYQLIERHRSGVYGYFSYNITETGIENPFTPDSNTYCIIGALNKDEYLQDGGYYEFKLIYKYDERDDDVLEWTQTSWLTDTIVTGADLSKIQDSKSSDDGERFRGLARSSQSWLSYLDGNGDAHDNWWQAIGSTLSYNGGIPGHQGRVAYSSELWIRVPGHYVAVQQSDISWSDANSYCATNFGSTLATIRNDNDANTILEMKQKIGSRQIWVGLNDIAQEGDWEWVSGYQCDGDCGTLSYWYDNEPNDWGNNEDCALTRISASSLSNLLNDWNCENKFDDFICDLLPLQWFGWTVSGPLKACQGDCDFDTDCESGLQCIHDDIPMGCRTDLYYVAGGDYCGIGPENEYEHIVQGCVNGNNIIKYTDKSVVECQILCDAMPECLAIEYGVEYGGSGAFQARDCQLQSSANYDNCDGSHYNLDLYIKVPETYHWLVPGAPDGFVVDSYLCGADSSSLAALPGPIYENAITVTCCDSAGTAGYRDCSWIARTYSEAEDLCASTGRRLCTLDETERKVASSTGCLFDRSWNWVSTECTQSTSSVDSSASYHWVVIGSSQFNKYISQCLEDSSTKTDLLYHSSGSTYYNGGSRDLAVSCCSSSDASRSGCQKAKTYEQAVAICSNLGMRLCTTEEMEADKTRGKGCGFDIYYNWVSDTCGDYTVTEVDLGMAAEPIFEDVQSDADSQGAQGTDAQSKLMLFGVVIGAIAYVVLAVLIWAVRRCRNKAVKERQSLAGMSKSLRPAVVQEEETGTEQTVSAVAENETE